MYHCHFEGSKPVFYCYDASAFAQFSQFNTMKIKLQVYEGQHERCEEESEGILLLDFVSFFTLVMIL